MRQIKDRKSLKNLVAKIVMSEPVLDMHTHLFPPEFGDLLLWGIDDLLTFHYVVAEFFRKTTLSYEHFWSLSKSEQADRIWQTLFIENSPISEACSGVVMTLKELGLDPNSSDLRSYRNYFSELSIGEHVDKVLKFSNVNSVIMTNDPFDPEESKFWHSEVSIDARFLAALRIDVLLNEYAEIACDKLLSFGYEVDREVSEHSLREIRRFLSDWIRRIDPKYMAVSLPPDFKFPEDSVRGKIIEHCILPIAREFDLPFALMIGVKRGVNEKLGLAGDGLGKADLIGLENLLRENSDVKFLSTLLSRENQHELCVLARKFSNLMIFGCWWFVNNRSIIEEITRERFEMLGLSVIPQHSDSRVLDQLIYKWKVSREIIAEVLTEKYETIVSSGWELSSDEIERDVARLFAGNFNSFLR